MVSRTLDRTDPTRWRLGGDVDETEARAFVDACRREALTDTLTLELGELELESGVACGLCVDAVRVLLDRGVRLTLVEAPQNLAHVLYRVGLLPRITLVWTRADEATSS